MLKDLTIYECAQVSLDLINYEDSINFNLNQPTAVENRFDFISTPVNDGRN